MTSRREVEMADVECVSYVDFKRLAVDVYVQFTVLNSTPPCGHPGGLTYQVSAEVSTGTVTRADSEVMTSTRVRHLKCEQPATTL